MFTNLNWEMQMVLRVALATIFGILIGIERQKNGKVAGIRTFATIALGTAAFTLLSTQLGQVNFDNTIVAAIIIAAGLLSARMSVVNQNTAEMDFSNISAVWATAAISAVIALGYYVLGGFSAAILLAIFWFKDFYNKN
jgi:putative Mg2+ transporter-C (MgtC) family protein